MSLRKKLTALLLTAGLAVQLGACGSGGEDASDAAAPEGAAATQSSDSAPAGPVDGSVPVIRYISWTTPNDPKTKPVYDAISDFAAAHSAQFTLEHENILGDELKAKIRTDIASNTVPDIFIYWGSKGNSKALLEANVIIPFDEYLDESDAISRELFPKDAFDRTSSEGTLTTITTSLQYGVWLCNKELFDQAGVDYPKSLDDMLALSEPFHAIGITPFAMGSKGGNPSHEFVAELLGQMPNIDADFENLNVNYTVDSENFRNVMGFIDTMRANRLFPSDTIAIGDWAQHFAVYNEGKAAMIYAWTWQISDISPEMGENTVIIDAPLMPGATRDVSNYTRSGGDMGPMISKAAWDDPAKHDSIIAIVDYLYSTELAELSLYNGGGIPSRMDVEVDATKLSTPVLADVIAYAKGRESSPSLPETCPKTECWTAFADSFDELFAGLITPDQVIENIDGTLARAKE